MSAAVLVADSFVVPAQAGTQPTCALAQSHVIRDAIATAVAPAEAGARWGDSELVRRHTPILGPCLRRDDERSVALVLSVAPAEAGAQSTCGPAQSHVIRDAIAVEDA